MNKTGTVFFLAKYLKIFCLFKSFKSNYLFMYLFYLIYLYLFKSSQGNQLESHARYENYTRCEYKKKLRFVMMLHFSGRN